MPTLEFAPSAAWGDDHVPGLREKNGAEKSRDVRLSSRVAGK